MTGFARHLAVGEYGTLAWEARTVNHRYLDISLRLSDSFAEIAPDLRSQIKNSLQRGKCEISLQYIPAEDINTQLTLNKPLLNALKNLGAEIQTDSNTIEPWRVGDLLRWPGMLNAQNTLDETLIAPIKSSLDLLLNKLQTMRGQEGDALKPLLNSRLEAFIKLINIVRTRRENILTEQREKILQKITDLNLKPDEQRLEQELVYLAQKYDVAEELDRLDAHVNQMKSILNKGGVVGRKLDFLMQEFNREANTLGSKSNDSETTKAVVEMKVLIEQMREQIQNIE